MRSSQGISDDASRPGDLSVVSRIGIEAPASAASAAIAAPGVQSATGRLSLALPLPSAPARGAAPALALTYSSGAGSSAFGYGWTVPISFIGPDLSLRYPAWDGTDEMALDGGETLVPEIAGALPFVEEVHAHAVLEREVFALPGVLGPKG